eukprot:tig00021036_g17401.t1
MKSRNGAVDWSWWPTEWLSRTSAQPLHDEHGMEQLVDLLARNAHEVWARKKKREGFMYGPDKSKQRQINNLLVPYECLGVRRRVEPGQSASAAAAIEIVDEQAMAKNTVKALLRLLIACGYEILPPKRLYPFQSRLITMRHQLGGLINGLLRFFR